MSFADRVNGEAVAACYGWPKKIAQDDAQLVIHLSELNRAIATGGRDYAPFATDA